MNTKLHTVEIKNKNLPTLVLLHGFLGSGNDWKPFLDLWQEYFSLTIIDLPGHGNSLFQKNDFSKVMTFEDITDIINNSIKSESFYLLGYSMGGRLALCYAARFPQKVKKLICISSAPGIANSNEAQKRLQHDQELFKSKKNKKNFLLSWYQQSIFKGVTETTSFDEFLETRMANSFGEMQQALNLMSVGRQPDMWQWLLSEKVLPILYIYGENDEKYKEIGQQIKKKNANISIKAFSQSSHMPQLQEKDIFSKTIVTFLTGK